MLLGLDMGRDGNRMFQYLLVGYCSQEALTIIFKE